MVVYPCCRSSFGDVAAFLDELLEVTACLFFQGLSTEARYYDYTITCCYSGSIVWVERAYDALCGPVPLDSRHFTNLPIAEERLERAEALLGE